MNFRVHNFADVLGPAGDLNDLHVYDPVAASWADLSNPASGSPPSARDSHGFAAAGGLLYMHGGQGATGEPARPMGTRIECVRLILPHHNPFPNIATFTNFSSHRTLEAVFAHEGEPTVCARRLNKSVEEGIQWTSVQ